MNRLSWILSGVALIFLFILLSFSGQYIDLLWFEAIGYTSVFWVTLLTGPLTKMAVTGLIFGFFLVNLLIVKRAFNRVQIINESMPQLTKEEIIIPGIVVAAVLALLLSSGLSIDWTVIQQFLHRNTVGIVDPIFQQDVGYYLFAYPFYKQLNNLFQIMTLIGTAGTALMYFLAKNIWKKGTSLTLSPTAKIHLTLLTVLFFAAKIWDYSLGKFSLMFLETSRMTGINYTAEHARVLAFTILSWLIVAIIGLLIFSLFHRGTKLLLGSILIWMASSLLLTVFYPGMVQKFKVTPNEFQLEAPYLKYHIDFTRRAYALDRIKQIPYLPTTATTEPLTTSHPSLIDLRLWDYEPLLNSYNQLQSIRPYYQFNDIDIDRYPSTTGQRQVMISARELLSERLPEQARTWINLHLTYTHGYGFVANQVNQFSSEGQPIFISRDLPPKIDSRFPGLKVTNPGIYFGETTNSYAIVNTKNGEFDYAQGDQNVTASYQGVPGIPLKSILTKALMAFKYQELNFLLSPQLTQESNILLYRNIKTRVKKIAPFLSFDHDPYLVVSGGKLYWIIDAYTSSSTYPYARPYTNGGFNYLRNSVKALVDAYNGTVNFYIVDPTDPIIQVWQRVFPSLFKSLNDIDPELQNHFRYPEDLLTVQRDMLLQYHMTNPRTFYEKEDYWNVPEENEGQLFEPYYVTLKLPEANEAEFVLMQPFTPRNKQNLTAWLIARCDQPNYGELILYTLPKDQNIYGPEQIDSRINQDETISQLVTLWNQQQSNVVWGNLLIIPLEGQILYLKPLFMESERGRQAELKKIVMVYENQILIGDTITEVLSNVTSTIPTEQQSLYNPKPQRDRRIEIINELLNINQEEQRLSKRKLQLLQELKNY